MCEVHEDFAFLETIIFIRVGYRWNLYSLEKETKGPQNVIEEAIDLL